jgi:hypothetical protein
MTSLQDEESLNKLVKFYFNFTQSNDYCGSNYISLDYFYYRNTKTNFITVSEWFQTRDMCMNNPDHKEDLNTH